MNQKRPVIVIVAVVLGIMLGALGAIGGCFGIFGQLLQGASMQFQEQMAQGNPALEAQLGPQRALIEAQAAFTIPLVIGQVLNVIASIALIVGAAMFASLKRAGATLLMVAAVACFFIDAFNAAAGVYMSYAMQDAIQAAMSQMAPTTGQDPAMFGALMQSSMTVGIVMAIGMLFVKGIAYGVEIWAVRDATAQNILR